MKILLSKNTREINFYLTPRFNINPVSHDITKLPYIWHQIHQSFTRSGFTNHQKMLLGIISVELSVSYHTIRLPKMLLGIVCQQEALIVKFTNDREFLEESGVHGDKAGFPGTLDDRLVLDLFLKKA